MGQDGGIEGPEDRIGRGRGHGQGEDGHPKGGDGRFQWIDDPRVRQQRFEGQLDLILEAIPDARTYPREDRVNPEYLYQASRLLVRDQDLDRVLEVLNREDDGDGDLDGGLDDSGGANSGGRRAARADGIVNGLSVVDLVGWSAPGACEKLDRVIGNGVASPDHIFYVCVSHCCPADEPSPVATQTVEPAVAPLKGTGAGVAVTIIDTGWVEDLAGAHPWLTGVTGEPDPCVIGDEILPYGGHGSFIAGVVRSVAPETEIKVISFVDQSEKGPSSPKDPRELKSGRGGAITESSILRALYQAMEDAPDVISLSGGSYTRNNVPPLSLEVFYQQRLRHLKGTVLVAAAGNESTRQPFWPAAFEWCLSVGALDANGQRAPFSNFGSWVDVWGLGVDLVNAFPKGTYAYHEPPLKGSPDGVFGDAMARWSGTSFSTPLVAGVIAARISRTGQSGLRAAKSIRRLAQGNAILGVGAHVEPELADQADPRDT